MNTDSTPADAADSSPALQIRHGKAADAASLAQIEIVCFDPTLYGTTVSQSYFAYLLQSRRARILIAEQQGEIAGYAFIVYLRQCAATWFNSLAVIPQFQGKGVANALFKQAEAEAVAAACPYMILEVRADNRALRWRYGRAGYQLLRTVSGYYADGGDAVRMFKML